MVKATWIMSIATVIIAVASLLTVWYSALTLQTVSPKFALVNSAGSVVTRKNFGEYGLIVEKRIVPLPENRSYPEYRLRFDREPDYFDVTTRTGAVSQVEPAAPKEYKVIFIGSGYGSPTVETDFKITAY